MTGKILVPPILGPIDGSLIFTAGPIQGAEDWQSEAIEIILGIDPDMNIANPRRPEVEGEFTPAMYNQQVDWETMHLRKASEIGAILFWLAREKEHVCRRAYAQTSRFELAEWKMRHQYEQALVVVGIEPGFSGAKYVQRRLAQDCPNIPIFDNLEDTCRTTVDLANSHEARRIYEAL